jgi:hypothetical protein
MICLPSIAKREGCALLQRAPTSAPVTLPSPLPTDNNTNHNNKIDSEDEIVLDNTDANNNPNEEVDGSDTNNNIDIKAMLMALGGCVECPNDNIMNSMMITSCMMGPLYGVMRANRDWLGESVCVYVYDGGRLEERFVDDFFNVVLPMTNAWCLLRRSAVKYGVTPEDASYFVGRSYLSMVQDAERNCQDPKRFDDLIEEQTPGGLNEQVSFDLDVLIISITLRFFGDQSNPLAPSCPCMMYYVQSSMMKSRTFLSSHCAISNSKESSSPMIEPWMQFCLDCRVLRMDRFLREHTAYK